MTGAWFYFITKPCLIQKAIGLQPNFYLQIFGCKQFYLYKGVWGERDVFCKKNSCCSENNLYCIIDIYII